MLFVTRMVDSLQGVWGEVHARIRRQRSPQTSFGEPGRSVRQYFHKAVVLVSLFSRLGG
jgi:hypothetical protein